MRRSKEAEEFEKTAEEIRVLNSISIVSARLARILERQQAEKMDAGTWHRKRRRPICGDES